MPIATISIPLLAGLIIAAILAIAYFFCSEKYPKLVEILRLAFFAVLLATLLIYGRAILG